MEAVNTYMIQDYIEIILISMNDLFIYKLENSVKFHFYEFQ